MSPSEAFAYAKQIDQIPQPAGKKIFVAGTGAVGETFLRQLSGRKSGSHKLIGLCNSKYVRWLDTPGEHYGDLHLWRGEEKVWDTIIGKLSTYEAGSVIFVDTTGSHEVAELYGSLLPLGIHIVTPSKIANTRSQKQFDELHALARRNDAEFRYETNVGAGLPVIGTLQSLLESGDEILEITGVLSGTMTYLFSQLDKGESFSDSVIRARSLGYAEPDPRDDLSGEDVARKFLILARICGLRLEREEIGVESLIPPSLQDVDATDFLERLPEADDKWKKRMESVLSRGNTLRYTGILKDGAVRVGIREVPKNSPVALLNGTTNLIQIKSRRYRDQPLIIQGPGAGKEVTAAGVLADVLKIM
jgi:aspartokinase/homoserine dehydrogenase 1